MNSLISSRRSRWPWLLAVGLGVWWLLTPGWGLLAAEVKLVLQRPKSTAAQAPLPEKALVFVVPVPDAVSRAQEPATERGLAPPVPSRVEEFRLAAEKGHFQRGELIAKGEVKPNLNLGNGQWCVWVYDKVSGKLFRSDKPEVYTLKNDGQAPVPWSVVNAPEAESKALLPTLKRLAEQPAPTSPPPGMTGTAPEAKLAPVSPVAPPPADEKPPGAAAASGTPAPPSATVHPPDTRANPSAAAAAPTTPFPSTAPGRDPGPRERSVPDADRRASEDGASRGSGLLTLLVLTNLVLISAVVWVCLRVERRLRRLEQVYPERLARVESAADPQPARPRRQAKSPRSKAIQSSLWVKLKRMVTDSFKGSFRTRSNRPVYSEESENTGNYYGHVHSRVELPSPTAARPPTHRPAGPTSVDRGPARLPVGATATQPPRELFETAAPFRSQPDRWTSPLLFLRRTLPRCPFPHHRS